MTSFTSGSIRNDQIVGKLDSISEARDQQDANLIADLLLLASAHPSGKMPSLATRSIFSSYWECDERLATLPDASGLSRYRLHLPWSEKARAVANSSADRGGASTVHRLPSFELPKKSLVLEHVAPLDALSNEVMRIRRQCPGDSPEVMVFLNNHYRLAVLTVEEAKAIDRLTVNVEILDANNELKVHSSRLKHEMPFWDHKRPFIRYEYATRELGSSVFDVDSMSAVTYGFSLSE